MQNNRLKMTQNANNAKNAKKINRNLYIVLFLLLNLNIFHCTKTLAKTQTKTNTKTQTEYQFADLPDLQNLKQSEFGASLLENISMALGDMTFLENNKFINKLPGFEEIDKIKKIIEKNNKELKGKKSEHDKVTKALKEKSDKLKKLKTENALEKNRKASEIKAKKLEIKEDEYLSEFKGKQVNSAKLQINQVDGILKHHEENLQNLKDAKEREVKAHIHIVDVLNRTQIVLEKMIGSVSGKGRNEHINATETEKRDEKAVNNTEKAANNTEKDSNKKEENSDNKKEENTDNNNNKNDNANDNNKNANVDNNNNNNNDTESYTPEPDNDDNDNNNNAQGDDINNSDNNDNNKNNNNADANTNTEANKIPAPKGLSNSFLQISEILSNNIKESNLLQISLKTKADQEKLKKLIKAIETYSFDVTIKKQELIEEYDEQISDLEEEIKSLKDSKNSLEKDIEKWEGEKQKCEEDLETKRNELILMEKDLEGFEKKSKESEDKMQKEINELEKRKRQLEGEIKEMNKTLDKLIQIIKKLP